MPRPKSPTEAWRSGRVAFRVLPAAAARYQDQAARTNVDLATRLRRMLTYAEQHMPDDWTEERA